MNQATPASHAIRGRLQLVCDKDYGGNVSQMSRECSVTRKPLQRFLNGDVERIQAEMLARVALGTPEVSLHWLVLGLGACDDPFGAIHYAEARLVGLRMLLPPDDEEG